MNRRNLLKLLGLVIPSAILGRFPKMEKKVRVNSGAIFVRTKDGVKDFPIYSYLPPKEAEKWNNQVIAIIHRSPKDKV